MIWLKLLWYIICDLAKLPKQRWNDAHIAIKRVVRDHEEGR